MDVARGETVTVRRDEEATHDAVELGPHDRDLRDRAVGDPALRTVEPVAAVRACRGRQHAGRIAAEVGLGEAEASDRAACGEIRQPLLFLLLGAERPDRIHDERTLHRAERANARVTALELLADETVGGRADPRAAIAGERWTEQAHLAEHGHEL